MKISRVLVVFLAIMLISCQDQAGKKFSSSKLYEVDARRQTDPVVDDEDAADDPAIWVNHDDPSKSFVIGTNKQRGLLVYDLEGKEVFAFDCGRANNVDVRQGFPLGGNFVDIVAASNRTDNTITLTRIMPSGKLIDISSRSIISGLNEVYGFCLYHDRQSDQFFAFINGKDGRVEQWLLFDDGNEKVDAKLVRSFDAGSQTEGCVADDELGHLYIGEENQGIWKYSASPQGGEDRVKVDDVSSPYLEADIEGLTIWYGDRGRGYLIASSQGNNTFAVYEREGDNKYIGSFAIVDGTIDGVKETDGIDVCSASLGPLFPHGLFVAQDGFNTEDGNAYNQNFKLVPWDAVAESFDPELSYNGKHGCSVFTIAKDGQVFFGGNDDYIEPDSYYWVDPGDDEHYGVIWIGQPDNVQQGVNEMGLAYDANGLPRVDVNPHDERQPVSGAYTSYPIHIMHECATVEEVIDWVNTHQWHSFMHDQMQFADTTGDAVIISAGKDGELVYTRKEKGDGFIVSTNFNVANPANGFGYPCWRYDMARGMLTTLLKREKPLSAKDVTGVLDAIHQEGVNGWTVGSMLADLSKGIIYIYYFYQFDHPVIINVRDELENPRAAGPLSQLFPDEIQKEAQRRFESLKSMGQRCQRIGMAWVVIVVLSLLVFLTVKGRSRHHFWFLAMILLGPLALTVWLLAGRSQEQRPWKQAYIEVIGDIIPLVVVLTGATVLLVSIPTLQGKQVFQFMIFYIAPLAISWLFHGLSLYKLVNIKLGRFMLNRLPHIIIVTNLGLAGIFALAMSMVNQSVRICAIMPLSPWTVATWWFVFVIGALVSGFLLLQFYEKNNVEGSSQAWSMITSGITETRMKTWRKLWWQVILSFVILALGMGAGAYVQQAIS